MRNPIIDLTGQTFDRLTVKGQAERRTGRIAWRCECTCGSSAVVTTKHLRGGRVRSCGCLRREQIGALKFDHGQARAKANTKEFRAWCSAKERCYNPNHDRYALYGGRGVRMAAEWLNDFAAFFAHIGPKPDPKMTVDRIDPNGHYEPGNVRWATASEQRRNQRRMIAA